MSGYTKSYREKWQHPVFRDLLEAGIWAWMCDTAAWKDTKIRFNGELVSLRRGQLVTSIRFMSEGFRIGEQVTRTFLENLKNEGMANTQPTHRGTVITICNYDKYQENENSANTPVNEQPTSSQRAANTNKKELKNKRTKEINISRTGFEIFWKAYPRHEGKKAAQKAYDKTTASDETIMNGLATAKRKWDDPKFIPHAATWLNGERWQDEPAVDTKQPTADGERKTYEWHKSMLEKKQFNLMPEYRIREKIAEYEAKHANST